MQQARLELSFSLPLPLPACTCTWHPHPAARVVIKSCWRFRAAVGERVSTVFSPSSSGQLS